MPFIVPGILLSSGSELRLFQPLFRFPGNQDKKERLRVAAGLLPMPLFMDSAPKQSAFLLSQQGVVVKRQCVIALLPVRCSPCLPDDS